MKIRPRFVIHIGAHLGQDRTEYLNLNCGEIVWIEADPITANKLKRKYPKDKVINFAIWDKSGLSLKLFQFENEEKNSLIQPLPSIEIGSFNATSIEVKTLTLDQLFESPEFNLLYGGWLTIDVQGAELHVLAGANESLMHFDYLVIEVANDSQGYTETPTLSEVEAILSKSDFYRSLSRISHDESYTDYLFIRRSKKARALMRILDSCFAFATTALHFIKKKHLKSSSFYCEKCDSKASKLSIFNHSNG